MMKCNGYQGKCHSHNANWSGLLELEEFTPAIIEQGVGLCRACRKVCSDINTPNTNARRPGYYAAAGGMVAYYLASKAKRAEYRAIAIGREIVAAATPRFNDGSPPAIRKQSKGMPTGATNEGPGFVYIYQNELCPEYLKIGAEKVSHGRLAQAGTWGMYRCLFNAPFELRFAAERAVHVILASKRVYSNKEIFKCSELEAQVAIETVALRVRVAA